MGGLLKVERKFIRLHHESASGSLPSVPAYNTAAAKPHAPDMLTTKEAGDKLGVSHRVIVRLIHKGDLGAFYKTWRYGRFLRRAYYVPVNELKRYLTKKAIEKLTHQNIRWLAPKS